jgi:hypothetical protein
LAESYTACHDDVAAFTYNPSALSYLSDPRVSILYHKGMLDDAYAHLSIGIPMGTRGVGISVGTYDGGPVQLYDGTTEKTVTAERDVMASVAYANRTRLLSWGLALKMISSELAESAKGTAAAADAGLQIPLSSRVQAGIALQNMGSRMTYIEAEHNLPRVARAGLALKTPSGTFSSLLLLDTVYDINDESIRPALGLELTKSLIALRLGYKFGHTLEGLTAGAGISLGLCALDYSFGIVDKLENHHRISLSLALGRRGDKK